MKREVWAADYEGHKLMITGGFQSRLWIDGEEAGREKGLLNKVIVMPARIPGTYHDVVAKIDYLHGLIPDVEINVNGQDMSIHHGLVDSDGSFIPFAS